jgi:hypothetical protein
MNLKKSRNSSVSKILLEMQNTIDTTLKPHLTAYAANWKSARYSDFKVVGGSSDNSKEFKVHRVIIAPQSKVFAAAFDNEMKEKEAGKMFIDDFSADVVEGLLHWMYSGTIQDESLAIELYRIAARYEVERLKAHAESLIIDNVDESDALEVLLIGNLYESEGMKCAAFEVIKSLIPEREVRDELMNRPEILKVIVESYRQIQELWEKIDQEMRI